MSYSELVILFQANRNEAAATKMATYMKNLFPFLGISSPQRRLLAKEFLKGKSKTKAIDWPFVFECFDMPEREFQYLALDYLILLKKHIEKQDIDKIGKLIQTKSWWDTVDGLDQVVGEMVLKFQELKDSHIRKWMHSSNIWLTRIAIDFQLSLKEKTDTAILAEAILANIGSKEFFINKAIGWSLRDYSKTNRAWVKDFVENHKTILHPLSVREASKYL